MLVCTHDLNCRLNFGAVLKRSVKVDLFEAEGVRTYVHAFRNKRVGLGLGSRPIAFHETENAPIFAVFELHFETGIVGF